MKPIKPTSITPALLPPGTDAYGVEHLLELSAEEVALRHRLELRVKRALYRAAVVLQAVYDCQDQAQLTNTSTVAGAMKRKWKERGGR